MSIKEKNRESWLDIARGIAIVFVVLGHVVSSYRNSGLMMDSVLFQYIFDLAYSFHMPLFFFVSGYLLAKTNKEEALHKQILKKISAYGIPYVIFSILHFLLKTVAASFVNSEFSINDLFSIFVYPPSFLWFIYALMIISIVEILLKHLFEKRFGTGYLLVVLIVSATASFLCSSVLGSTLPNEITGSIVFDVGKNWVWVCLGEVVVKLISEERFDKIKLPLIPGIISASVYAAIVFCLSYFGISIWFLNALVAVAGIYIVISISKNVSNGKVLKYLGRETLPIYLLHGYIISAIRVVLVKFKIPDLIGVTPLVICSIFAIGLSLLFSFVLSKIRYADFCLYPNKYLFKRKNG